MHTRLNATAIVLQRGDKKVALVSMDLFMVPGGLLKEAADRNADLGFNEENVLASASHTHAGPTGFANFNTYNTTAPSTETTTRPETFVNFFNPQPPDPQLYTFLVERLALAIRQAARGARPAAVGLGRGVADERHEEPLDRGAPRRPRDHQGPRRPGGRGGPRRASCTRSTPRSTCCASTGSSCAPSAAARGRASSSAGGASAGATTAAAWCGSPSGRGRASPTTARSTPPSTRSTTATTTAPPSRVFEQRVRDTGKVSPKRMIVNVYGNSNEGDQSAGLD